MYSTAERLEGIDDQVLVPHADLMNQCKGNWFAERYRHWYTHDDDAPVTSKTGVDANFTNSGILLRKRYSIRMHQPLSFCSQCYRAY